MVIIKHTKFVAGRSWIESDSATQCNEQKCWLLMATLLPKENQHLLEPLIMTGVLVTEGKRKDGKQNMIQRLLLRSCLALTKV
jgi:hypothetical protein